jgi:hypothetical protein
MESQVEVSIKSLKKEIKHFRRMGKYQSLKGKEIRKKMMILDSLMSDKRVLH